MDLERGLSDQEQPAADQDQVAPGHAAAKYGEQRRGEPDDPGDRQEKENPHEHRGQQARATRPCLLVAREFPRQDGDENHVVDAEDDLEERQRDEGEQTFGGQEGIHSDYPKAG